MDDKLDDIQEQIERQKQWEAQQAAEWAQSLRDAEALAAQSEPSLEDRVTGVEDKTVSIEQTLEVILGGTI